MPATPASTLLENAQCFACLGMTIGEALALAEWDAISQAISVDPVADFISRAGITDQTQIDAVQALYDSAVANGWWDKCDLIYPFVGGNAQAHAQNLKSSNFTITWFGAVTHDANGITGDGATGYGDTGYIPSSSGQVTLNSVHLSRFRRSIGNDGSYNCGGIDATSSLFISKSVTTFITGAANSPFTNQRNTSALTLSAIVRNDAVDQHFFNDIDTSAAIASTGIPTVSIQILCLNNAGVPSLFTTANLSSVTLGTGISFIEFTAMKADWVAFNTAIGR